MAKYVDDGFGVRNIEAYEKNGEYFLKVTSKVQESNGDVFRYVTDGIKLGIYHGDDALLSFERQEPFIDCNTIAVRTPCGIKFGFHNNYELSKDSVTTRECIERHVKRCTIEELERELGCRLEIVSEDD